MVAKRTNPLRAFVTFRNPTMLGFVEAATVFRKFQYAESKASGHESIRISIYGRRRHNMFAMHKTQNMTHSRTRPAPSVRHQTSAMQASHLSGSSVLSGSLLSLIWKRCPQSDRGFVNTNVNTHKTMNVNMSLKRSQRYNHQYTDKYDAKFHEENRNINAIQNQIHTPMQKHKQQHTYVIYMFRYVHLCICICIYVYMFICLHILISIYGYADM